MRFPTEFYQIHETVASRFPTLRDSQIKGLALWVLGTVFAGSACQTAVINALEHIGARGALRQRLREWLYNGQDRATPCNVQLEPTVCFVPLLEWVLSLWRSDRIALAIDPTAKSDKATSIVISVLYRGSAIPVAWTILPGNEPGEWIDPIVDMLEIISRAIPEHMTTLVMCDRGLRSPKIWDRIVKSGWHPYMRQAKNVHFRPDGDSMLPAIVRVPGPGWAYVGVGTAFKNKDKQVRCAMIVVWDESQTEPWIVMTDLSPREAGVNWYMLRFWIEMGFRGLKSVGWKWNKTQRTDPSRVSRHWLVLSVATLWALSYGTRVEDARDLGRSPSDLRAPPKSLAPNHRSSMSERRRIVSVLSLGIACLRRLLYRGTLWKRVWLLPEPWPEPSPNMEVIYHPDT